MRQSKLLLLITLIIGISVALTYYTYSPNHMLRKEFTNTVPKPLWWDDINIGDVSISNYDELITYWQSEKRCCSEEEIKHTNRIFFKAMYLEILDHIDDPDIVVNAIDIMTLSYLDYDYFYPLQLFALKNYPDYNKPLHACANCMEGDVIASLLEDLQYSMAKKNLHQEYIDLTHDLLKKRGLEMSDYYEARVYLALAKTYENSNQNSEGVN